MRMIGITGIVLLSTAINSIDSHGFSRLDKSTEHEIAHPKDELVYTKDQVAHKICEDLYSAGSPTSH